MRRAPWVRCLLLALVQGFWAQSNAEATIFTPQDCNLDCIKQGGPACQYCRVTQDIQTALGFKSIGGCIPRPCSELLGKDDPHICQHFVQAPDDVKVEFLPDSNSQTDTVIISWRPSRFGIAFLRGFQVLLQALGGSTTDCQLLLFHRNVSLSASHAQRVYQSDPFSGLSLSTQYVVTVVALPIPERWEKFNHNKIFDTRYWYPSDVSVQQNGTVITVTFNLAPPNLGIRSYFLLCSRMKKCIEITPNFERNQTHHSYQMKNLQEGANYTCEIAANEVDAVRKVFSFQVKHVDKEAERLHSGTSPLALLLPLCLVVFIMFGAVLAVLIIRSRQSIRMFINKADLFLPHKENWTQDEITSLSNNRQTPPRLLICYSSAEGLAHVKAVQQLAAFIQQHMATQVCLDLWNSLSLAEEGYMAWYCRQIRESDFVLVVCSESLNRRPVSQNPSPESDEEELYKGLDMGFSFHSTDTVIPLIGAEVGRARAQNRDLSKYIAAIFEYSQETDIPTELQLISHYILMRDLPLLFSHLHGVPLHRPGVSLNIKHISKEGFTEVAAGAALQRAIIDAGSAVGSKIWSKERPVITC
ncbi:interleukin-17 receptor D isoform X2 [Gouania willdenowi]|uniref:Interleukin-17 receptor D-like n=1 Tax=Gouania willdenowi TaxID=441366 RepID=A0A8C5EJN1_GOUWI|nr:interleukin-17 receptor D-like isoform X2 [Gouania willdenowi]